MKLLMLIAVVSFISVAHATGVKTNLDLKPKAKSIQPASANEVAIPNFEKVQKKEESKIPTECQAIRNGICVKNPNGLQVHPHGEHRPNGNLKLGEPGTN